MVATATRTLMANQTSAPTNADDEQERLRPQDRAEHLAEADLAEPEPVRVVADELRRGEHQQRDDGESDESTESRHKEGPPDRARCLGTGRGVARAG